MSLFTKSVNSPSGRAVLLSIKPKYADLILSGSKKVELRRSWPSSDIGVMILYSSAPVQRLVGVAHVEKVEECDFDALWEIADSNGGGVTREELKIYVQGKRRAFGIMINKVEVAQVQVDPKDIFNDFIPPQSFLYLTPSEYQQVMTAMFTGWQSD